MAVDARWFKQKLEIIASDMGGKHMISARQKPEPGAQPQQCFNNVDLVMDRRGGTKVFGWTPHWRLVRSEPGPGYLFLTHHAVWRSPVGMHVDVTPYPDPKHAPLSLKAGYTPLIVDMIAQPVSNLSLPLRFIALDINNPEIVAYVADLNAREAESYAQVLANSQGDPP